LGVAKGTLSYWFKGDKRLSLIKQKLIDKAKRQWAKNITLYNKKRSLLARQKWIETQKIAEQEIGIISKNKLLLIGTALYWSEGYKRGNWSVVFVNADPLMNQLMMRYFREICGVAEDKIRAQVQVHNNISYRKSLDYWSKIIHLPKVRFYRPMIVENKASKLRRRNNLPYGTLRIKINDVNLLNRIKGWINGLTK
jgi:hypothetical protein